MSFFEKIAQEYYDESHDGLIQSVAEQMAILFSNRNDKYWAYDFNKRKMVGIHDVFHLDYYSPEFEKKLAYALGIFDRRIFDIKVSVVKTHCGAQVFVECKAMYYDQVIKIPVLSFDL